MEAEAPIDRVAAIAEVRKLRDSVAVATGISAIGSVNEGNESHA
jgi:hypothetical protein